MQVANKYLELKETFQNHTLNLNFSTSDQHCLDLSTSFIK